MKNLLTFLILLGLLFPATVAHTQSCLPNGIYFASQDEIDSFSINYPGCTEIGGDVSIGELYWNTFITNLNGLTNLTSIGGELRIWHNDLLTNIDGLGNLASIGDDLQLEKNDLLTNIDGLANLASIGGNLKLENNDSLTSIDGLANLASIGGDLTIKKNTTLVNIDGLVNLASIGGNLKLENNAVLTSIDGLANLTSIAGNLYISSNYALTDIDSLTNLTSFLGDLTIKGNTTLANIDGLANITSIGGLLDIEANNALTNLDGLANVSFIEGNLTIEDNNALTSLDGLANLTSIGDYLSIKYNTKLTNLDGLANVSSTVVDLDITGNYALTNLDGLINITSIEGLTLEFNYALTNLDGLLNVTSIAGSLDISSNIALINLDGLSNVTSIEGSLSISGNNALTNLDGLANVTSIWVDISISSNNALTNLDGLTNVNTSILGNLDISGNNALTNLDGLANLPYIWGDLGIKYNNMLTSCCGIQGLLATPDSIGGNIDISNNPSECSNESEILAASCNPLARVISGKVFYDFNQNKLCDSNESGISGQKIWFNPPGHSLLSNQDGKYHQLCDSGTLYQVNWIQDPDWSLTTDSASYQFNFTPGLPSNLTKDFGLYPNFTKHEGKVNLSSNPTRCNTDVKFFLRAENLGTYMESGYTLLHYDPSCTFISATPASGVVVDTLANTLVWYYDSLYPFQYLDMEIIFGMPDQNSTNTPLQFLAKMYRDSSGTDLLLDSYTYSPIVRCSFDPNDKQVMPSGERDEHYTLHDQKLTYTIRFQNTGNAEAIDIRILDTLDTDLDINTLRIVNSSFPVQTSVKDQAMEFFFKNILLPDSTSNEPESHGFVTYEIQPKSGLADYTEIQNTAYIIFDSNDDIVTNTTTNTMVTTIPVTLNEPNQTQISIHPNPANDLIYISAKNQQSIDKVLIYNNLGELVLAQKDAKVDVSHLPKGLYLVKVQIGDKMGVAKLIRL